MSYSTHELQGVVGYAVDDWLMYPLTAPAPGIAAVLLDAGWSEKDVLAWMSEAGDRDRDEPLDQVRNARRFQLDQYVALGLGADFDQRVRAGWKPGQRWLTPNAARVALEQTSVTHSLITRYEAKGITIFVEKSWGTESGFWAARGVATNAKGRSALFDVERALQGAAEQAGVSLDSRGKSDYWRYVWKEKSVDRPVISALLAAIGHAGRVP